MATADWIVIGVIVLFGFYGLSRGLVRGALSLAGFALGAYLGAQIAPAFLSDGSPYAPLVALGAAILGGVLLQTFAGILGGTLRAGMGAVPGLRSIDSAAGAVLGVLAGFLICWAFGAVLLYLPGQSELRRSVQESAILSRINEEFPPERLLETLERVDPIGVVVGPPAVVPPPDSRDRARPGRRPRRPERRARHRRRVRARRRRIRMDRAAEASSSRTRTSSPASPGRWSIVVARAPLQASVVAFDAQNDVASSACKGSVVRRSRWRIRSGESPVALIGYPGNGPLAVIPGRLGGTGRALSRDAYGRGPVSRNVTAIRGEVRPGLSGGPGIDGDGRVRTVVFARRPDDVGGYGVPPATVRDVLEKVGGEALSTECAR